MAVWNKIKFLHRNILNLPGSALTADSEAANCPVSNLANMLEANWWKAANITTPMYITLDAGSGKITNGDFEIGATTGWSFFVDTGAGATATFTADATAPHEGTYKGLVNITSGGSTQGNIQLYQMDKSITDGKKQYVKFAAKCSTGARTVEMKIQKQVSPWTVYIDEGIQIVNLTSAWQVFDYELTANITANDARLQFGIGGSDIDVDLDIISWWEEGAVPMADSLALYGHNLSSVGVETLGLHYSDTNFATNTDAFTSFKPVTDRPLLKEFSSPLPHKYWRIYMTGTLSAAPLISAAALGLKTELGYSRGSFDPHAQAPERDISRSYGGVLNGVSTHYIDREMALQFFGKDAAFYALITAWWEECGRYGRPFLVAWENANNPDDIFLMWHEGRFFNPFKHGGTRRDITLNLKGRRE